MSDKQREEFEKWYKENINKDGPFMGCGKLMRSEYAMFGLMCWQAAIASVVVEIPKTGLGFEDVFYMRGDQVVSALDKAGIRYE